MKPTEEALTIDVVGRRLVGVLHRPGSTAVETGLVVVVGGPQYRVGSHRQFTLLSRALCEDEIPVLRFDYTGMGDSDGAAISFEAAGEDIRAAVDTLFERCPSLVDVHLWGLCDGASAALMYAPSDARVTGLVLLNPWVRTTEGQAQAYIENYYGRRLRSGRVWRKIAGNPVALFRAALGFVRNVVVSRGVAPKAASAGPEARGFLASMLRGAEDFKGGVLVLLSGMDLVATEFELLLAKSPRWKRAFERAGVRTERLPAANHTFSRREWSDWVAAQTSGFVSGQGGPVTHANCDSVGGPKAPPMRD